MIIKSSKNDSVELNEFIKKGYLCFDIGANRGDYTKKIIKLGASVVCVEPQLNLISRLKKISNMVIHAGCGKENGFGVLTVSDDDRFSSFNSNWTEYFVKRKKWKKVEKIEVPMITIDFLIQEFGKPDFIKIDSEQYEYEILLGLSQFIPLSFEVVGRRHVTKDKYVELSVLAMNRLQELKPDCLYRFAHKSKIWVTDWIKFDKALGTLEEFNWGDVYCK